MTTYVQILDANGVAAGDRAVDLPSLLSGVSGGVATPVIMTSASDAAYQVLGSNYSVLVLGSGITYDDTGRPLSGKLTNFVINFNGASSAIFSLPLGTTVAALNAAIAQYTTTLGATSTLFDAIFAPAVNFSGGAGADAWTGTALADTMQGGGGADTLNGGANPGGGDWVSYAGSLTGVTIDLALQDGTTHQAGLGDGAGDVLANFENLKGSAFADRLSGNAGANAVDGGAGNDTLVAGTGNDTLTGGLGSDLLSFETVASQGITFSLAQTRPQANGALGSILATGFENLTGGGGNDTLTGSSGRNVVSGGAGDDLIDGGADRDTLAGGSNGAGGDTISYAASSAAVQVSLAVQDGTTAQAGGGDAGGDVLSGFENAVGSSFGDTLTGDDGGNRIDGGIGDDTIAGGRGDDTIIGGAGGDRIDGGDGRDAVSFETSATGVTINFTDNTKNAGADAAGDVYLNIEDLTGSSFADRLTGDAAFDSIAGRAGNDTIEGVGGGDTLDGGSGIDTVSYTLAGAGQTVDLRRQDGFSLQVNGDLLTGFENILGSAYADRLTGTDRDTLLGATGAEVIDGGAGDDTISGGTGDDTLIGGLGNDWISFADVVLAGSDGNGVTLNLGQITAQITNAAGRIVITGFENVRGTAFADRFTGTLAANTFDGGAGVDCVTYDGSAAGVTVDLGSDAPQVSNGAAAGDVLLGIENLVGSAAGDVLKGDNLNDNVIEGGGGNDTLDGGGSTAGLVGDTVSYARAASGITINLGLRTAQNTGGAGSDVVVNFENVSGSAFADQLTGDAGANIVKGCAGDDSLRGGGGADTLDGGANGAGGDWALYDTAAAAVSVDLSLAGSQISSGDAGGDVLIGIENLLGSNFGTTGAGNGDTLSGNSGDNKVYGGAGDDSIAGGAGNDDLRGGAGSDSIDGGAGNDSIDGGIEAGGGAGQDWVTYAGADAAVTVTLASTAAQNTIGAGIDRITGIENLTGSAFGDRLTGSASANILVGGGGDDTIAGGLGADTIWGGTPTADAGSDVVDYSAALAPIVAEFFGSTIAISGGGPLAAGDQLHDIEGIIGTAMADTFIGGSGDDIVYGGKGNDLVFARGGSDTIDGGDGFDTADFSDGTYDATGITVDLGSNANGTGTGAGFVATSLTVTGVEQLIGSIAADALTGNASANLLQGGSGADTLAGGAGNDTLQGGFGNDRLIGQGGSDTLTGGAGSDTFVLQGPADKADHITDFSSAAGDIIEVSMTGFGLVGVVQGTDYDIVIGTGATPSSIRPTFLYNAATGVLSFDADGKGAGAAQALLTLDGQPALSASSLVVR